LKLRDVLPIFSSILSLPSLGLISLLIVFFFGHSILPTWVRELLRIPKAFRAGLKSSQERALENDPQKSTEEPKSSESE